MHAYPSKLWVSDYGCRKIAKWRSGGFCYQGYVHPCLRLLKLSVWLLQSQSIGMNPLYVMIPCTLSTSFAFMLPVATPPNAIVFSYGYLKVADMVSMANGLWCVFSKLYVQHANVTLEPLLHCELNLCYHSVLYLGPEIAKGITLCFGRYAF